jgi:dihydroorotate dehydrogenase
VYRVLRSLLFKLDPETAHEVVATCGSALRIPRLHALLRCCLATNDPRLRTSIAGLSLENPVGLAAGFDKVGKSIPLFSALGFSFIEVGTVTPRPQPGNPRPRIFRFAAKRALVNRMGFPSEGVDAMIPHLKYARAFSPACRIGVNIGKNKDTPIDSAITDYSLLADRLNEYADYIAINVSSPNTPDLRKLQEPARLLDLFQTIDRVNKKRVPVFVKLAPDISESELPDVLKVIRESSVAGVIATNTTLSRATLPEAAEEVGGASGAPLFDLSLKMVREIYRVLGSSKPIIGVGGIMSGREAEAMIRAGASAIQVYTGLVYEGPMLVKNINVHLAKALTTLGKTSISEMVGIDAA